MAAMALGSSAAFPPPPFMRGGQVAPPAVVQQLGSPSVASRMYFGFESVRVIRYAAPAWTAKRVGVLPDGLVMPMEVAMAVALFGAGGISAGPAAPHMPSFEKYLRPQLIWACVVMTTVSSAVVIDGHFVTHV